MNIRFKQNRIRKAEGNLIALSLLISTLLLIPAGIFLDNYFLALGTHSRYQSALEATALLAAEQLSTIVVNDPHFGFVSLSNQPPIGLATVASDGEPCTVRSINNVLGTIRLDTIIAHELGDANLRALANADYEQSETTIANLQSTLIAALEPRSKSQFADRDGHAISIYSDAVKLLTKNLQYAEPGYKVQIRNLHLSLGFINGGGPTVTPVPMPFEKAVMPIDSQADGNYRSCLDIPAFGQSFFFAPVAKSTALVNESSFASPDGKRICSVIKLDADLSYPSLTVFGRIATEERWLHVSACAIPNENTQVGPSGALLLFFPCGVSPQICCLKDLLNLENGDDPPNQFYQAVNGDFPVDSGAATASASILPWSQQDVTSKRILAAGLYSWLRAAGVKPRIDATLNGFVQDFSTLLHSSNLLYEFDRNGQLVASSLPGMPLPISVLSDQQLFAEVSSGDCTISCYNNVYNLGTILGGKHAGEALDGDPINWCDLEYFGLSSEGASQEGKGRATGLYPVNDKTVVTDIPGAVLKEDAEFQINGKPVKAKPRKSYYSGGLAVELSISAL
jgi:hypothetical protein